MAEEHKEIDPLTGTATTGHEWDGIRELNTPLPRWWLWTFYACIVWAIGYWIVYPAWPLLTNSTQGVFGWHARSAVVDRSRRTQALRGPMMDKLTNASVADIVNDPQLARFRPRAGARRPSPIIARPATAPAAAAAKGYPNLNDDDWLWGGKLAEIEQTIRHGARSGDHKDHEGNMPAFGRDGMLKADQISAVADFVRSLSGLPTEKGADLALGKKMFADNCAVCHGAGRQGQSRGRRAQSHRQDLALRAGQGNHHARHRQRARRRDAGLGRPPERRRPSRR